MKKSITDYEFVPALFLAFFTIMLTSFVYGICDILFGLDLGIYVGTAFEELIKVSLFIWVPRRAFQTVVFFALLEIALVKLPAFCFDNIECFAHGIVFSALSFVFHLSTALLYRSVFTSKHNNWLFSATLLLAVTVHVVYNAADLFIDSWCYIAVFCLTCSLIILSYRAMFRKLI